MKTVVSITPISIERDSRTLKQASSVARLGYKSIVVEVERSRNIDEQDLLFRLLSMNKRSSTNEPRWQRLKKLANKIGIPGIPIAILYFIWQLLIKPFKIIPPASLYYIHGFTLFPIVWLKCFIHKAKFIYDAHDFYSDQLSESKINNYKKNIFNPFYNAMEKLCIKKSSKVVTVTEGIADLMERRYKCHPTIIHNYEDLRLFKQPNVTLRQKLKLEDGDIILLVLGNAKKGIAIAEVIQSIYYLPKNVHIVFVGRYYESYVNVPEFLNLSSRVHFVDAVMPYEVVKFVESADISLVLYIPDNKNNLNSCPNKFFQSISAGLPVLYSKLPEVQRYAEKYELGVRVDTLEPHCIAHEISNIINNQKLLTHYKVNLKQVKHILNWEAEEHIYSRIFAELF